MSKPKKAATRERLKDSQLPSTYSRITADVNAFRRFLEEAVRDRHKEISVTSAAAISTACRAERSARVVGSILRRDIKNLDSTKQADMLERIVRLSERRDAAIGRMKLDRDDARKLNLLDVAFDPKKEDITFGP